MMNTRMLSRFDFRRLFHSSASALGKQSGPVSRAMRIEMLRPTVLLSIISVASYMNGNSDRAAIQAAIDAAQPGDTIAFEARNYSIDGTLQVHTGLTLTGQPDNATILTFSLSGAGYGMTLDSGAKSVTIQSLNMVSSSGVIGMYLGSGYRDIHITKDSFQFGGGSTANGTAIFGIYGTVANPGLQITSNYFHDSLSSVRDWEIWDASDAHLDSNTLYKVTDGGHIVEPGANVSYSNNYGVNLRRMGQEIQGSSVGTNLKVNDNTFYDWVTPYYDSFGLSVVNHNSTGTEIARNYLRANIDASSDWGIPDGGGAHRFGYAIEAGGVSMTVHDNIIVGNWIAGVVASRLHVSVTNNSKYGPPNWGDWIGEPSIDGYGSVDLSGDSVSRGAGPDPTTISGDSRYAYNPAINGTPALSSPTYTGGDGSTGTGSTGTGTTGTGSTGTGTTGSGGGSGSGAVTSLGPQNTGVTTSGATSIGSAVELDPGADTTPVTGTLGTLTVTPLSSTTAKITWTQNPSLTGTNNHVPSVSLFEVDVQSTVGREHFPSVLYSDDLTSATVINLHPGWQIDFTVSAFISDGRLYRSGPKTAMMPGNSLTGYSGLLWGGISSVQTPHG